MKTPHFLPTLTLCALCANSPELLAQIHTAPNGSVGIGTSNPTAKLDVVGAAGVPNTALFYAPSLGPRWSHVHFGSTGDWYIRSAADSGRVILQDFGGRVGIGTSSPAGKLHLYDLGGHVDVRTSEGASVDGWAKDGFTVMGNPGAGFASLKVHSGHNAVSDRGLVSFERQGSSYLYVRMDGNVGLGTKNPLARLDVQGGIRCTSLDLTSDRAAKGGIQAVDDREVLERLSELPIATWHYTDAPEVRHLGPMAQDFQAAFGLGSDDTRISVVDGLGVSLAAIQGLHRELKDAQARLREQAHEVDRLREDLLALRKEMLTNPVADLGARPGDRDPNPRIAGHSVNSR